MKYLLRFKVYFTVFHILLCFILKPNLQARRSASVGGKLTVALKNQQKQDFIKYHSHIPILHRNQNRSKIEELARPKLKEFPQYYSNVIEDLKSKKNDKTWLLRARFISIKKLDEALTKCFDSRYESSSLPAALLNSAHIKIIHQRLLTKKTTEKQWLKLQFQDPFPLFPEFLNQCFLDTSSNGAAYIFRDQQLIRQNHAFEGSAFIESIQIKSHTTVLNDNQQFERSHIQVDGDEQDVGSTLLTFYPEMIFMLPSRAMLSQDPLNLNSYGKEALGHFHQEFQAQTIADLYAPGRSQAALQILPSGITPSLQSPKALLGNHLQSLRIQNLRDDAAEIKVIYQSSDPILQAVFERFVVLFQSRGIRLIQGHLNNISSDDIFFRLIRWHSESPHPVLAMSSLLNQIAAESENEEKLLYRLLRLNKEEQIEQSLLIEQQLLNEKRVIPILQLHHYYMLPNNLKGAQLLENNILDLSHAYWEGMQ